MYHGICAARFGLDSAIHALAGASAAAPYLRLHIMGEGEALPQLEQLARRLGIIDRVVFFPPGPPDAVVDFVAQGDIGIIPYTSNGLMDLALPSKAYEFASMRRPIIASNTPAIRSMFRPTSMVLCEPSSVESFRDAIVDLYRHPQKRAQLVASAEYEVSLGLNGGAVPAVN
jgi:glycosyltransferase involved in cell wall biosynthesis